MCCSFCVNEYEALISEHPGIYVVNAKPVRVTMGVNSVCSWKLALSYGATVLPVPVGVSMEISWFYFWQETWIVIY